MHAPRRLLRSNRFKRKNIVKTARKEEKQKREARRIGGLRGKKIKEARELSKAQNRGCYTIWGSLCTWGRPLRGRHGDIWGPPALTKDSDLTFAQKAAMNQRPRRMRRRRTLAQPPTRAVARPASPCESSGFYYDEAPEAKYAHLAEEYEAGCFSLLSERKNKAQFNRDVKRIHHLNSKSDANRQRITYRTEQTTHPFWDFTKVNDPPAFRFPCRPRRRRYRRRRRRYTRRRRRRY